MKESIIENYPSYSINTKGEVFSYKWGRKKKLIQTIARSGYFYISLYDKNNKRKGLLVHRLVAKAFIENTFNYREVNHIDGNKLNNKVENLEWVSPENHRVLTSILKNKRFHDLPIKRVSLDLKEIIHYPSVSQAARLNNIDTSHIFKCLKRPTERTAKNYMWFKKEDEINYYYNKHKKKNNIIYENSTSNK